MLRERKLILLVDGVCIIVILFFSLQFLISWLDFKRAEESESPKHADFPEAKAPEKKPRTYYSIIEEKSLFGIPDEGLKKKETNKESSLFRLRGTVVLSSGKSYAILEDAKTGTQKLYRVGDRVGEETLVSIRWAEVVLASSRGQKVLQILSEIPQGEKDKAKEKKIEKVVRADANKHIVSRSFLEDSAANANQILTQLRVKPYFVSGNSEGYWIGNIQEGSIVEEMGFRNGDIIKKINGQMLDSPEKMFQLYQEIKKTGMVVVDVERNNRIETLSYEIRD